VFSISNLQQTFYARFSENDLVINKPNTIQEYSSAGNGTFNISPNLKWLQRL
jgi:hypothetical protein